MTTRSTQFYAARRSTNVGSAVFVVPAEKTALVKWITARNGNAAQNGVYLGFVLDGAGSVRWPFREILAGQAMLNRELWWVLETGDELWVGLDNSTDCDIIVSGALLPAP